MPMTIAAATFGLLPVPMSVRKCRSRSAPNCSRPYGCGIASVPLMLWATASHAAFDRSSSGRITTWLRTPTRPFSRRQPRKLRLLPLLRRLPLVFVAMELWPSPALGLEVLDVDVLAHAGVGDHAADVLA